MGRNCLHESADGVYFCATIPFSYDMLRKTGEFVNKSDNRETGICKRITVESVPAGMLINLKK